MDPKNFDFQSMMSSFMQNAQQMQEGLKQAHQDMMEKNQHREVIGQAGGGLVKAHVNLKVQLTRLEMKPEFYQESPEVMNELIVAAVNQGIYEAQQLVKTEMMEVGKKMGLPAGFPMPWQTK